MRIIKLAIIISIFTVQPSYVHAIEGVVATESDVLELKKDLISGKIQVGKTRLNEIRKNYGEASNIESTEKWIKYNYGDLRMKFEKKRIWTEWKYDTFKTPVYTDDVDDLRFDLESGELVGDNITLHKIIREYDLPTEMLENVEDGEISIYYYGNIKMVFENRFLLQNWRAQQLGDDVEEEVLEGN